MDKLNRKKRILDKCREILKETESNLKDTMDEAQKAANEYGPPKDRYDSFRTQLLRKRDMFGQQLLKVNEQIEALDKVHPEKIYNKVEFGAVVITDSQKLFISTGIGKFMVDDETYFAISGVVPVFKAMEGKRAGDEFEFNGRKMKILEVF